MIDPSTVTVYPDNHGNESSLVNNNKVLLADHLNLVQEAYYQHNHDAESDADAVTLYNRQSYQKIVDYS